MKLVTQGTKTATGGIVLEGHDDILIGGRPATSVGQNASCASGRKSCKGVGEIVAIGNNHVYLPNGLQAVLPNYKVLCNCNDNLILVPENDVYIGSSSSPVSFGGNVDMGSNIYINMGPGVSKTSSPAGNRSMDIEAAVATAKEVQIVNEEEVMITIIVELPHSKETGWGAKGLAGHTGMAIGDRYFDYGPDYYEKKANEQEYNVDFNKDGDLNDTVDMSQNSDFYFAPGRSWWGKEIANTMSINVENVTLDKVYQFIQTKDIVYGTVYKIEFYIQKSQADKMLEWWEDRYKHLKIYSVKPWVGEQCTTTVKEALAYGGIDDIDWNTLTPEGMLEDLKTEIKSTSIQHKDQKATVELIKKEAKNWKP